MKEEGGGEIKISCFQQLFYKWNQCKYWINIVVINASQVLIVVSVRMVDFQELFRAGGHQPSPQRPIIQPG